jgi:glycosyltransferase involved in cell wall biosynthesis
MSNTTLVTPDYIFESSWEVCNKVGGIYTVLSTRAKTLQEKFPDKLIFIGPDLWLGQKHPDFIESKTVLKVWKKHAEEKEGLKVRAGRWAIPGKPMAILVDFRPFYDSKSDIYFQMWEKYGINSTAGYGDYDESCMFAIAAAKVIESLYHYLKLEDKKVIAQLNEWMLGMAALYLHDQVPAIATIFTTHATSIGRSICGNNKPLYCQMANYHGDQMAQELNMVGKHTLEKVAAHHVDAFTTVSEITGEEATQLLDKQPDVITPNGFESNFVPVGKEFEIKRKAAREALIRVAEQLTGDFIPDDALLLATSGRYEYKNKGIDVFIEAMNRVKHVSPNRAIVAFILVPAWTKAARKDLQERLQHAIVAQEGLRQPFITHDLEQPDSDPVCNYLYHLNFTNEDHSLVKLIFVPSYLHGSDGIFNLPYYDLLIGLDLTVFPSYYEPWGYTPLESIAFHVPTITTNLAGFGLWVNGTRRTVHGVDGVTVIERTDDNYFESAEDIKNAILKYAVLNSAQMLKVRKAALALSGKASWAHFIQYYYKAYAIALSKKKR